jgi:CheY-like chemotaxis protein
VTPTRGVIANILLAEDNEDDVIILSNALRRLEVNHAVIRVANGEEAIAYLKEKPRPDLVVLDLKMPKQDGFDVLAFIRTRPELAGLPVIILTASDWAKDKKRAEQLGIADYLVKQLDWSAVAAALKLSIAKALAG